LVTFYWFINELCSITIFLGITIISCWYVSTVQNEIINNYVAYIAKYAAPSKTVKISVCYNSIPAQLAKENKKFQYKVVQKDGNTSLYDASLD